MRSKTARILAACAADYKSAAVRRRLVRAVADDARPDVNTITIKRRAARCACNVRESGAGEPAQNAATKATITNVPIARKKTARLRGPLLALRTNRFQLTRTALHAAATAFDWVEPDPYRSFAALIVATRASA